MVALRGRADEPTRRGAGFPEAPAMWRAMCTIDAGVVRAAGKVVVSGEFPRHLIGRPVLMASNHIGMFDPFVLMLACRQIGFLPRFMLTAGLLDAPVLGYCLQRSGHLRVDRGKANIAEAFGRAIETLKTSSTPLLVYPEGRVSRDPGLWPERGKTGVARMALAADVPVITISQWGAHEAVYWGTEIVRGPADVKPLAMSYLRAMRDRPTFKVHFGNQVDLSDLRADKPGDARRAHARIMQQITADLVPLRRDEPDVPKFYDPTRPTDTISPWKPTQAG